MAGQHWTIGGRSVDDVPQPAWRAAPRRPRPTTPNVASRAPRARPRSAHHPAARALRASTPGRGTGRPRTRRPGGSAASRRPPVDLDASRGQRPPEPLEPIKQPPSGRTASPLYSKEGSPARSLRCGSDGGRLSRCPAPSCRPLARTVAARLGTSSSASRPSASRRRSPGCQLQPEALKRSSRFVGPSSPRAALVELRAVVIGRQQPPDDPHTPSHRGLLRPQRWRTSDG